MTGVQLGVPPANPCAENALQGCCLGINNRHLATALTCARGNFGPDPAPTHHHDLSARQQLVAQGEAVIETAKREYARQGCTCDVEPSRR